MKLIEEEKAQISAEMIVVMAAVLAVSFIMIKGLSGTATKASNKMNNKTDEVLSKIDEIGD